jgi:hypothetical protein
LTSLPKIRVFRVNAETVPSSKRALVRTLFSEIKPERFGRLRMSCKTWDLSHGLTKTACPPAQIWSAEFCKDSLVTKQQALSNLIDEHPEDDAEVRDGIFDIIGEALAL